MIDELLVVKEYVDCYKSLREISKEFNTNHHRIKRILLKNNVVINNSNRKRNALTEEHKMNISKSCKGRVSPNKGKKMKKETLYKNMVAHIKWNVNLEFLLQFEDIEKLKFLNKVVRRDRVAEHFDTEKYKSFVLKFYYDNQFNNVYENWIEENKSKFALPSLDHIIPLSKGGSWDLENLQFLPWCVNRAKVDFLPNEWEYIKNKYFKE